MVRASLINENHLKILEELDRICFPIDPLEPKHDGYWWIIWYGDQPIGFCGLKQLNKYTGYLCRAGIIKKFRGNGLHGKMVRKREKFGYQLGLKTIVTNTHRFNLASANNLIKFGYLIYLPKRGWKEMVEAETLYFIKEL